MLDDDRLHPQLILITGLSGAGKSTAYKALEEAGFFCVDNLPAQLIPAFLKKMADGTHPFYVLVMDARDHEFLKNYRGIFEKLRAAVLNFSVIFFEAADLVLLSRYSAMRRCHPARCDSVRDGISKERLQLSPIRALADTIIDTTGMTPHDLRGVMLKKFDKTLCQGVRISLISFGFKYGLPSEADLLFDVRFLANPYFVDELKDYSGLDAGVAGYVLQNTIAQEFMERLVALMRFLIPQYDAEGKTYLTICVGCTGGHHRSVAVVERLAALLQRDGHDISLSHRDLR